MKKRIVTLVLALALVLSLAAPALAADGDEILTRGEFVRALYELSGEEEMEPRQAYFEDVPMSGDLAVAVRWAVQNGIVNGYGDGRFGPDDPVTREQMAAMLYRNAQRLGQGFQGMWMFLLDYPDADQISPWADEAMHWVVMKGIIIGTDKGLEPKATATDDQLALVLQRWQESVYPEEEDGQNPVMNFVGEYQCDRAHAVVEAEGKDLARVVITWGGSAWEQGMWVMSAPLDPETLRADYDNCTMCIQSYKEDGSLDTETVVYEDGTGYFQFGEGSSFVWHDDREDRDLTFEWSFVPPAEGWTREGYFINEAGDLLSVIWMDDVDEPGWYVGCMIGELSAGAIVREEDGVLRGELQTWEEGAAPLPVTVSEEGEAGLLVTLEGGESYHFLPWEIPEATIFVHINTEGDGNIDYAEGETAPEIDEEYPFQSAQINLAEPTAYTFTAWTKAEGWRFVKWTKDGEDFSAEATVTVELAESAEYVAVFALGDGEEDGQNPVMNFVGEYQCDRAHAVVEAVGKDLARVVVTWSGSAWEQGMWVMSGPLDPETLRADYADGRMTELVYDDSGEVKTETVVYEDGTGYFQFSEGSSFIWHDDREDRDLTFEWSFVPEEDGE